MAAANGGKLRRRASSFVAKETIIMCVLRSLHPGFVLTSVNKKQNCAKATERKRAAVLRLYCLAAGTVY